MSYARSTIKSRQASTITLPSGGANSVTATVTAVTTGKCRLTKLGETSDSASVNANTLLELTNTTTVTATRNAAQNSINIVVGFELVEEY